MLQLVGLSEHRKGYHVSDAITGLVADLLESPEDYNEEAEKTGRVPPP